MPLFQPMILKNRITEITPQWLRDQNIKALLLDVDNTIAKHNHPEPLEGVREWLLLMESEGFPMLILSNAFHNRVKGLADELNLKFIAMALKPLPFGFLRAKKVLGLPAKEIAIIGDQVYTDIMGGNICGMKTVLVVPVETENKPIFRLRRKLEKSVIKKYYRLHKDEKQY